MWGNWKQCKTELFLSLRCELLQFAFLERNWFEVSIIVMLTGCLPQVNICQGHSKPKLPKYVHNLFKQKETTSRPEKKCYPKQVILKLNFYNIIAERQENIVAKIFRIILLLLKMQEKWLHTHNTLGVQAAEAWKVSGCARRNPATHHTAFQKALNSSKTQRISCEEKQECDTLDHKVHSWLSSLAPCTACSTVHM